MTIYSTEFNGSFKFSEKVSLEIKELVNGISETRRVTRDVEKLEEYYGDDFYYGQFFIPGVDSDEEEDNDEDFIIDSNTPPGDQPGLWMDWKITDDGRYLVWNGSESFRFYLEWLDWLNNNIFVPEGLGLNGAIHYQGWDDRDNGTIFMINNQVKVSTDFKYTYGTGVHYEWDDQEVIEDFNEMITEINNYKPELDIPHFHREVSTDEWKLVEGIRDVILIDEKGAGKISPELDWSQEDWVSVKFYEDGYKHMVYLEGMTNEERFWSCIEKLNELAEEY